MRDYVDDVPCGAAWTRPDTADVPDGEARDDPYQEEMLEDMPDLRIRSPQLLPESCTLSFEPLFFIIFYPIFVFSVLS